ncbi:hypothetical protein GCM10025873_22560 [Demequina sediminis]|nr:hypothetical protein GCM10025873_22560 [Demequina sediminis]
MVDRCEDHGLAHVTLARGAVAEVADHRAVALGVAGAHEPVAVHRHRVSGRVERVGANHQRVKVEAVGRRVPRAVLEAAEQAQDLGQVDAAHERHAVLAVGRENEVGGTQRVARADLCGLLTQRLHPQAQLALTLQAGGLEVEAAQHRHVVPHRAQGLGVEVRGVRGEVGVLDALTRVGE